MAACRSTTIRNCPTTSMSSGSPTGIVPVAGRTGTKASGKCAVRTPAPLAIADAVMGTSAVRRAKADPKCEKSDAKQLRALYKRLLSCIVDGAALPRNLLESAVHRAEVPLTFQDREGQLAAA